MKSTLLILVLCFILVPVVMAQDGVPMYINYQGKLTDSLDNPLTGDYWITFGIWSLQEGGTQKWFSNPRTMIHVEDGLFTYELGSSYPLSGDIFDDPENWLEITVGSDVITPRTRLVSVPYAIRAGNDGDWADSSEHIYRENGFVGIGMTNPKTKLEVAGVMRILSDEDYLPPGDGEGMEIFYDPVDGVGIIDVFERPMGYRKFNFKHSPVGIGEMNPQERLHVAGNVLANDYLTKSDRRFKADIRNLENVLAKLDLINAVSFKWNEENESPNDVSDRRAIGVIAQEVEEVFPEMVRTTEDGGYKSVSYNQLTAVLLEAVKELKKQNNELLERIDALERQLEK
jgi:hypothetical protein